MHIHTIPVGPFQMNCYILADGQTDNCLIIDPGDEPERLITFIEENGYRPQRIINTHAHIDHARRVADIQKHFDIPYYLGQEDLPLLNTLTDQGRMFGLDTSEPPQITGFLKDGERFPLGSLSLSLLHTPGHSPGSFCVYTPGHVFVGDVLFRDSIGRTDLYAGNLETLLRSIREKLFILPDDTVVYPGHGPTTTIGYEKQNNPFLNAAG